MRLALEVALWIFHAAGLDEGDELEDLFPGTGAITRAWFHRNPKETR